MNYKKKITEGNIQMRFLGKIKNQPTNRDLIKNKLEEKIQIKITCQPQEGRNNTSH